MITKWISFTVSDNSLNSFAESLKQLAALSKAEEGCVVYEIYRVNGSSTFTVLESWTTPEALEAHRTAPHTVAFKNNCSSMITEKSALELTSVE